MFEFSNSLAYRIFNFAIKIEKISKEGLKADREKDLEILAGLQKEIEGQMDNMFHKVKNAELLLKGLKKEIRIQFN